MDKFQEMRVFAAVVDAGSFVGAAQALDMSKPAVSRHLADLEGRLGVRLLQRTTRKLSLTEDGEVFFARCKDVLASVEEAESEITSRSGEACGLLKINAPVSFGTRHLAPLWAPFLARHPKLTMEVLLTDRAVDLVEEGYDLAVCIDLPPSSSLISRKVAAMHMMLCASPQYLKERGTPQHPVELVDHAVFTYSHLPAGDLWSFEGPEGPVSVKVSPRLHSNNVDTCRAVALHHGGIAMQPSFLVGDDLASGALIEVLPTYRARSVGIYAVFPTRKHLAPKVRLLVDYLAESLRPMPWSN